MEDKFVVKMLKKSFLQYGRDIDENPLSEDEHIQIMKKIKETKDQTTEWYEVIEDVVYSYLTNQD
jgi:YqzH-like protein